MGEITFLFPIFFFVAMIYAAAGFGGGSSYLLILTFFSFEFIEIRMMALLCNIAVVSSSLFIFHKKGFLKFRKVLPLVLVSVPFAFWGGGLKIDQASFFLLLGSSLIFASILMVISKQKKQINLPPFSNAIIGGGIGFLSGMVGIGGGIFLSPLLYLSRWADAKVIAATTAAFIFLNSISGLTGQIMTHGFQLDLKVVGALLFAVIAGGQIGARFTTGSVESIIIRRLTAVVIFVVAVRILIEQLG